VAANDEKSKIEWREKNIPFSLQKLQIRREMWLAWWGDWLAVRRCDTFFKI